MRILEVRRHTMRRQPGEHLSQDGIALARRVGSESGPFDRVATSEKPRAIETAIAMGFEVDEILTTLGKTTDGGLNEIGWPSPFARFAEAVSQGGKAARSAEGFARVWKDIVMGVPEGGRALIITHGGFVEMGVFGIAPEEDAAGWGDAIGCCEGVRLTFDELRIHAEVLRLPPEYTQVKN